MARVSFPLKLLSSINTNLFLSFPQFRSASSLSLSFIFFLPPEETDLHPLLPASEEEKKKKRRRTHKPIMASSSSSSLLLLLLLFLSSAFIPSQSKLTLNYYEKSCPNLEQIIRETITNKQINNPTTAGGVLRLFFHDCMVEGCDASILVSSNSFNKAERDADMNLSLSGDGFDVVVRAKTALELSCPGVVSCADILALTARDLITMVGGPFYKVRLGRKDGLISLASNVEGNLPKTEMSMDQIIGMFATKGFTVEEMVALTGGHTIGFSHCKEFADRLYNHSKISKVDPAMNPKLAQRLQKICASYKEDPTMSAFNDVITPSKFDNMYYKNLERGLGLLKTDSVMVVDPRTRPFAHLFATNQTAFFQAFSHAMEKLSVLGVKTGHKGEVRHRCDNFNSLKA